jgi:hypothetical protein
MTTIPHFLDRRPARPNAALEGGDAPEGDYVMGVIPTERHVVDIVPPEELTEALTDRLGGGKYRMTANRVVAFLADKRWHVIRED